MDDTEAGAGLQCITHSRCLYKQSTVTESLINSTFCILSGIYSYKSMLGIDLVVSLLTINEKLSELFCLRSSTGPTYLSTSKALCLGLAFKLV